MGHFVTASVVYHNKLGMHNEQLTFDDSKFSQCMKTFRYQKPMQKQVKILTALKPKVHLKPWGCYAGLWL